MHRPYKILCEIDAHFSFLLRLFYPETAFLASIKCSFTNWGKIFTNRSPEMGILGYNIVKWKPYIQEVELWLFLFLS